MRQGFAVAAARTARWLSSVPVLALAASIALAAQPASAAKAKTPRANPKFAAIVVDANTGKTLYSVSPDAQRFPASLTKMMTLYLTFEALKTGKIRKDTAVPFSAQAAAMPPTKLGIGAGRSVTVETAILALCTKSANDAAAALGELLGGSEQRFALMMTQTARGLGMTNTEFHNASGLPNPDQHTTARDMARLGVALRERFPEYYSYFGTRSFTFGRQRIANHNRLLGRVDGVDGIKTGYTAASGFNLVSSATDGNKRLVAVILGGTSGRSRDEQMAALIRQYLPQASSRGAMMASTAMPSALASAPEPVARRDEAAVAVMAEPTGDVVTTPKEGRFVRPKPRPLPELKTAAVRPKPLAASPKAAARQVDPVQTASVRASGGWSIQVASAPSQAGANAILSGVKAKGGAALASASPFTVAIKKGGATFYRARFGGFADKTAAGNACAALKKQKVECFAVGR